jgi:hypothetical protein
MTATMALVAVTCSIVAQKICKKVYYKITTKAVDTLMPSLRPTTHNYSCTYNDHSDDIITDTTQANTKMPTPKYSSIFEAAAKGAPSDINVFLTQGMSVNVPDATQGNATPLMYALRADNKENINFLLTHLQINLHQTSRTGTTALMLAAFYGNVEAVDFILQNTTSSDILKQCDKRNWNVCHYAQSRLDQLDAYAIEQIKIQHKIISKLKERGVVGDFDGQIDLGTHNPVTVKKELKKSEEFSVCSTENNIPTSAAGA